MSTAMSSKKTFVSSRHESKTSRNGFAALAVIAGLFVMIVGIQTDLSALMVVGFAAFGSALMYLNTMFWAWMYETKRLRQSLRRSQSQIFRY